MPLLTIHHKTEYRYAHPVAFGEHRIMLRPRDGHDLRVLAGQLEITPEPMSLRWIHDVFGNSVAIATFDERARTLSFTSTATIEHMPVDTFALTPDDPAYFYPFLYDSEEILDLREFIAPQYGDPDGELSAWARNFLDPDGPTPTFNILTGMTHGIRKAFTYRKRHAHGTQHPLDTLQTRSGTCRDYALFMIEALRRLGIAARFVSGYLFVHGDRAHGYVGGGSTHAWVQVYLAERGLDRVRSDQRHRRQPRSHSRRSRARSAPGDPAARHLSRLRRRLSRHGRQHQCGFSRRRGEGVGLWRSR